MKNPSSIYEEIFRRIDKLVGGIEKFCSDPEAYKKLTAGAYMDLHIDNISSKENGQERTYRISIAHNFIQNGDVMADPDMEIRIHPDMKMAEALTYQLDSLSIYREAYPEPGMVDLAAKRELNSFLRTWLRNIKAQGHC